jgi:4-amino-4-deoxy-L-arabinose transferase-like glycosyltransferase
MNQPSPAIVAQGAVRRLPRVALWLFCAAYVLPGLLGREPWKSADMTAFGFMQSLALGQSAWLSPQLMGQAPLVEGLLPYWLGAWAIQGLGFLHNDLAVRLVFAVMLALTLAATWYGVYYLARSPQAQPVAFAFGGEANPPDYARAMADGGLLACIATLGLAQLSHETTPAAVQLCCTALSFFAFAALPYRVVAPALCATVGLTGLALSGAPVAAVLLGSGGLLIHSLERPMSGDSSFGQEISEPTGRLASHRQAIGWGLLLLLVGVVFLSTQMGLWRWRIELPQLWNSGGHDWHGLARLVVWFTWPTWPLALWTLWRWRRQLWQILQGRMHRHLALPILFASVAMGTTLATTAGDRALLLAVPALAALAAFSLPTLGRSVASLIDWFTLLFFTGCALVIWVVWIAMQTGVPPQPAANVARLAPGFQPSFSLGALLLALAATAFWAWLVQWRVGRHRAAIWKSMVLPAGGAALCWLLLMTLWLPLLDFARSYTALTRQISRVVGDAPCVEAHGLDPGQIAAFQFHAGLKLQSAGVRARCPWLLVDRDKVASLGFVVNLKDWTPQYFGYRPTDRDDDVLLYRRADRGAP